MAAALLASAAAAEALAALFALSFVYAALSFAVEHQRIVTGACWLLTAFNAAVFIAVHRLNRGAYVYGASKEMFESAYAQSGFLVIGVSMVAFAATSAAIALFQVEDLVVSSWWMTMIASLMAAKWAALAYRQIRILNEFSGVSNEPLMA